MQAFLQANITGFSELVIVSAQIKIAKNVVF